MERWTIPECNGVARIIIFIPSLISGGGVLSFFACCSLSIIFSVDFVPSASLIFYVSLKEVNHWIQTVLMHDSPMLRYTNNTGQPKTSSASYKSLCYTLRHTLLRLLQQNRVLVHLILCCLLAFFLKLSLRLRPFARDTARDTAKVGATLAEGNTVGDVELYGGTGRRLGDVFRYGGCKMGCRRHRERGRRPWFGYFSKSVKHTFASGLGNSSNIIHSQTGCGNWGKH